ncbi:peptidase M16 [Vibrio nigripulchritudo]|uniref:M16 family metallopeptidase n=1 Tax=Vibrio nigripulchritudo TaxID=28173 RepID=UPI00190DB196|nr:pitrilysin family protein [Vibrio nigripulchritudo]BCL71219.1 peptidase M16 [Vibrio nigripulchritudo]BDU32575.1 peptidase M16 [Vibrio nigripulchritudo]
MRKIWFGAAASVFIAGCSSLAPVSFFSSVPEGITLVEEVKPQSDKVVIPYSKYLLDNGLTVILAPDESDPLVHVDVTYHVGSAREEIGKSGFAHFFEHMMFQGSENVGDQEHFRLITEAGGTLNGTTNRDRTNYFETVPANQLEKILWLESDRMGFLLDAVSQRKFEIQRDTVKNERAQNYDNRPYGLMWERIGEAMYPEGHPYSWQPIGYVEDLDRVNVNDLKAFFLKWYGPNNATLTIGGDFDTEETLQWINKYFGTIPVGPEVKAAEKQPANLTEDKFITLEDRIQQPMLVVSWPTEYQGHESDASLEMLSTILGDGKNSVLYQQFVQTGKAVNAGAYHNCAELACSMSVYLMGNSGEKGKLKPLYDELMETLSDWSKEGVSESQLETLIGRAEANAIFSLESVRGKVTQLALNETFFGQPDRIEYELEQLRAVTPESVATAYQDYLANQHKVVLSVVPRSKTNWAVKPATFATPPRTLPEYQEVKESDLVYRKAVDNFDRSVMPPVSGAVKGTMPDLYRIFLDSGVEILGAVSDETPTVQLDIKLPAGNRYVPEGQEGLANLTAEMMMEGTAKRSAQEIQTELDRLGSYISFDAGSYSTVISVSALEKNLSATIELVEEMIRQPAFEEADFDRIKQQAIQGIVYEHQKPSWLASQATRQVLFAGSRFSRSSDGSMASISSLTLDDVKQFYKEHYTPQGAQVVIVGDIKKREAKKSLAFLDRWEGHSAPLFTPQVIKAPEGQKIYLIDKPGAPQSVIRLVRQGLPFDTVGEMHLGQLANYNLSGNFNSRINQNLREDKGYTYGAYGYVYGLRETGLIVFSAEVRADVTIESIQEIINEMNEISTSGLTEEEMQFMRLARGQADALKYETPSKKAQLLSSILTYSLEEDYLEQRDELLQTVDIETLNQVAAKWFDPSDFQIIVVGDAKKLAPKLKKFDLPIEKLEIVK